MESPEILDQVYELCHPLILHKLTLMRMKSTSSKDFRELLAEISALMTYEVTKNLELEDIEIVTPLCRTRSPILKEKAIAVVPILRAGLGMSDGVLRVIPQAKVGHIGVSRDEKDLTAEHYYTKLPEDISEREVLVVDPMLATGGTLVSAISKIKKSGATKIKVMSLLGSIPGITRIREAHPDVPIYIAKIDEELNERGYIVPGLGDAGDRIFGTKIQR